MFGIWRTVKKRFLCGMLIVTFNTTSLALLSAQTGDTPQTIAEVEAQQRKIDQLITQLGDPQYANRVQAQAELKAMGLTAFDALHRARDHDDIEIAMRARYLVRSMQVHWAFVDDPAAVRRILVKYGDHSSSERKTRMEQLAKLEKYQGVNALCRLVRYEASEQLSKQAALLIMQQEPPQEPAQRKTIAFQLRQETGPSRRAAARWLKNYAQTLLEPKSAIATWDKLTRAEEVTLSQFPKKSSRDITRDLLRWQAKMLEGLDRTDEALAVIRRTLDLLEGTQEQLLEMVDWLVEREDWAWTVIEEVAERFPVEFKKYADLMYRFAEAQLKHGQQEKAEETAARALAINPDDSLAHNRIALRLQRRNLMPWCENEYRHVIKISPAESFQHIYARLLLSELLHDRDRDLEAANTLSGVVKAMEQQQVMKMISETFGRTPGGIRSRMHYFFSQHHAQQKDQKKHQELLEKGIQEDPRDADVLIAMYRLSSQDEAWKTNTLRLVQEAVKYFQGEIKKYDNAIRQADNKSQEEALGRKLASANNQLAWLVANTTGDLDEAIQCSKRSLELRPESAGYLDTLAHCYYAKGDYRNAVKHQQEAVQKEPYSAQMQRQLKLFQKSLRDQQSN